jgi:hypothetical protein
MYTYTCARIYLRKALPGDRGGTCASTQVPLLVTSDSEEGGLASKGWTWLLPRRERRSSVAKLSGK